MFDYIEGFLKATEKAAIATYPWVGKNDVMSADRAATNSLRDQLNGMDIAGVIKIGEGEMDNAPMLFIGERVGTLNGPALDIAVDPIDGTSLVASGKRDAIAVMAVAEEGSILHAPDMYMKKIACGPKLKGKIDITKSLEYNVEQAAIALEKEVTEICVAVQERPRHEEYVRIIEATGAKVILFSEVDITAIIATCIEGSGIDLFIGIGGAPEGVISAVALRSLGGDFQGQLMPEDDLQYKRCVKMGLDNPDGVLYMDDVISSDDCLFVATGITDGILLNGVRTESDEVTTTSFYTYGHDNKPHFVQSVVGLVK